MVNNDDSLSEVHIGNVSGGIYGSIIAGRDVKNATISIRGQPTPADKQPTVDELKQLLVEIKKELAEITTQQETLKEVSPAAPYTAQGAEQNVNAAAEKVKPEMKPEEAKSVQQSLTEATALLSGILDGARSIVQKAGEVGQAVKPIVEKLEPLVEKVSVAALWIAKLWLQG